jgi:hypothetical protein
MANTKGMDEFFLGKDMEDVFDWTIRFQMAAKVKELNQHKFFKTAKFNLKGKAQNYYHRFEPPPDEWRIL